MSQPGESRGRVFIGEPPALDVLNVQNPLAERTLPDGRVVSLVRDIYNLRVTVSSAEQHRLGFYDDDW